MNFYESLGFLVLGSRLRRLSESFLAEVSKIYAEHHLKFDASWFPIFYILSKQKQVSIRFIADELSVSHSAISQLVSNLTEKGLVKTTAATDDGRKKVVTFTTKGQKLQQQIEPVWQALTKAMEELAKEGTHSKHFLKAIGEMEAGLASSSLLERVEKHLEK